MEPRPPSSEKGLALWKQIRNEELTASDIPSPGASWDQIKRFAGSFDAYNGPDADHYRELCSQTREDFLAGRNIALPGLGLSELRALLFLHWRALRHGYGGGEPSSSVASCAAWRPASASIRIRSAIGNGRVRGTYTRTQRNARAGTATEGASTDREPGRSDS
jgi:hypothetical protein